MTSILQKRFMAAAVLAGCMVLVPARAHSDEGLTDAQRDGYRVWLHSVEKSATARQDAGVPEVLLEYPLGALDGLARGAGDTLSLLVVARELNDLESRPRLLQEPMQRTALHALMRARNHGQIAEFDTALAWFEAAAARDTAGAFIHELGPEAMATASAAGDSTAVMRQLLSSVFGRDPGVYRNQLILAYRFAIARHDTANMRLLTREIALATDVADPELDFWHAMALSNLQQWPQCLDRLLSIVSSGAASHGLSEAQRAWVLVAIPDLLVLTGRAHDAEPLYRVLSESPVPGAREWAACQVAVLDFLAGRFLEAGTALEQLCKQNDPFPWRSYACGMSELSDEMERLRREGQDHGAAAHYNP